MAFSSIPPEICAIICSEVQDSRSLAILCRTSRLFYGEAQRLFYHSADLRGRSMRVVKKWARAVTKHAHLAARVHALALQLPDTLKFDVSDATTIGCALAKCLNLKELKISGDTTMYGSSSCIHGWMINDCEFRLTKFDNQYFSDGWITDFWKKQTEIRVLSIPDSTCLRNDTQLLPAVIAVGTKYLQNLPQRRALQRIETTFHRDFSPLLQYKDTLTTLYLRRDWVDHTVDVEHTITAIAAMLPVLLHFGVFESRKLARCPFVVRPPTTTLRRFIKLETFTLQVRNICRFTGLANHLPTPESYDLAVSGDVETLSYAIMKAFPTLWRVAIGAEVVKDQELTCILTKTRAGEIHMEAGTTFDAFGPLSMFWNPVEMRSA
ncbi:hypothetical protein MVEN_02027100 [Mycena venus]|uniref:Uncharacterized protein n=1 Tax=Mycena venus TaxID=2733690 RepID=A0A8H6XCE4_9AGAR|nr:hypothetical protein MVEN_02027100 [Mycena venus]